MSVTATTTTKFYKNHQARLTQAQLRQNGKQSDQADEDGHHGGAPTHHKLQVHEYAAVLAGFRQVGQKDGDAQQQYRRVLADVPQTREGIRLLPADGRHADLLGEALRDGHQDEEHVENGHGRCQGDDQRFGPSAMKNFGVTHWSKWFFMLE